jgi:hypothetical protein
MTETVDALVAFDATDISSSSRDRDAPALPPKLPVYPEELPPRSPPVYKKQNLVMLDRKGGQQDMKLSSSSADTTAPAVATKVTTSAAK